MSDNLQEAQEFHAELGGCFANWTGIEMELLSILRVCLFHTDFETLAGTFYAVDNFRSKLAMVDTALGVQMTGDKKHKEWTTKGGLHQRIIAASKKRNNLAHWMVMDLSNAKKTPPTMYILPNIFRPSMKNFEPTRPTGGYFVHDLKAIRREFSALADDLTLFWVSWRGPPDMLQLLTGQGPHPPMTPGPDTPTSEGT